VATAADGGNLTDASADAHLHQAAEAQQLLRRAVLPRRAPSGQGQARVASTSVFSMQLYLIISQFVVQGEAAEHASALLATAVPFPSSARTAASASGSRRRTARA
jgi:hypothetical protein